MRGRKDLDVIVGLCRRRGFVYASSDIYGERAVWDYGPLGVELKHNIKRQWWRNIVQARDDVVGLDTSIILSPDVWRASGHIDEFVDPLTECQSCHRRFLVEDLMASYREKRGRAPAQGLSAINCPGCGNRGVFSAPRMFSGLLSTRLGAADDGSGTAYLRPETAQGIFINYAHVQQTSRRKPPFGIAQIGKSFRNEITPGNFLFRTREFEQMGLEFFVKPGSDEHWHQYWIDSRLQWYTDLGVDKNNLRLNERPAGRLAHYSRRTVDIEYRFDFMGREWGELEGIANRGDFDLLAHSANSGADLSYFDQQTGTRWVPYAIEPAVGVDRAMLCFLLDAYGVDQAPNAKGGTESRVLLRLDPRLAPVKVAVLPLSRNAQLSPRAQALTDRLRQLWNVEFDDSGAIGRRYRRQDEIGTPFCVTVDFETLDDDSVTVRDRDTMRQERVATGQMEAYLAARLVGC